MKHLRARAISSACLLGLLAIPAAAATEIPAGTHVLLRMENSISTRSAEEGDFVYLRTASPVAVNGRIVVPAGSYVQGVVVHTKRPGRIKGRAQLGIRLETLTLPGGQSLRITPRLSSLDADPSGQKVAEEGDIQAGSSKGQDARQIAILAGSGASLGAIVDRGARGAGIGGGAGAGVGLASVLLSRGKEAELRRGTSLDVVFERAVSLE